MRPFVLVLVSVILSTGSCKTSESDAPRAPATTPGPSVPPLVRADGSSTVFPISQAVAREFEQANSGIKVTVGVSGTGGGFRKFCAGETDVSNASRPIKAAEIDLCRQNGIEFLELPIGFDGLAVLVNPKNTWAKDITTAELKALWEPAAQGVVTTWKQVRSTWPAEPIHLFGPGLDSGTYDYFTEAIVHKEHSSRSDFTASEDDNLLVNGVAGDRNALGFFGLAYYLDNKARLRLLPVDDGDDANGKGPIAPSVATVLGGRYQPLSRPMFIYVAKKSLENRAVVSFIDFYLRKGPRQVRDVGYVPLSESVYFQTRERFKIRRTGSVFGGRGSQVGVSIEDLLKKELSAQSN